MFNEQSIQRSLSLLRVDVLLTENDIKELAYLARGYLRENPRKRWTSKEYREAARLAVQQIIKSHLEQRKGISNQGLTP